jgi:hypothetical protein
VTVPRLPRGIGDGRTWTMKPIHVLALAGALLAATGCRRHGDTATAGAHAESQVELPAMTVQQVADKIAHGEPLAIYDVNNRHRYETGHLPGARWVSLSAINPADFPADHATPMVFYCANEH